MPPVHFQQELFISCEDGLTKVAGFHNFASTLSSVVIMAHPLRSLWVAQAAWSSWSSSSSSPPSSSSSSSSSALALRHDAVSYLAAQLLLFYLNLHQHATGYVTPDLETGGALHSIFLAQLLHNVPLQDTAAPSRYRSWTIPPPAALVVAWASALRILHAAVWHPHRQNEVATLLGQPFALYVICTMGSRSYYLWRHRKLRRPVRLWITACLALASSQALVAIERNVVCPPASSVAFGGATLLRARTFHSVVIHAVIVLLFYSVSECAIELVREGLTPKASNSNKVE